MSLQPLQPLQAIVLCGSLVSAIFPGSDARAQDSHVVRDASRLDEDQSKDGSPGGRPPEGRPKVKLDQLTFPDPALKQRYEKYLRRVLAKEARRANWGAGRGSTIEYRFAVETLSVVQRGSAIQVKCKALGRLPKGKSARGQLEYGGDPRHQTKLVRQVLEIVARGVITRLAELERVRRGELNPERVRAPES